MASASKKKIPEKLQQCFLRPGKATENKGKFDFGKSFEERKNVVSISTPFKKNQVTEIDVHREEVSYIVSEEFFEQFTALAFIDSKEVSPKEKNCPACRVCHQEADSSRKTLRPALEEDSQRRHDLHPKF